MVEKYIGITGFTTIDQINEIIDYWDKIKNNDGTKLMIGVLVSPKTLNNTLTNQRYPFKNTLNQIFNRILENDDLFRVIHYNTRNPFFAEEVEHLFKSFNCDGVQLNISNPDPYEIKKLKKSIPDNKRIIFQANNSILNALHIYPFKKIEPFIDYCLIDPSGGRGIVNSFEYIDQKIQSIKNKLPKIHIGLAGGFNPDNIQTYVQKYPKYSFDVESGVRTNNIFDLDKAKIYLKHTQK